MLLERAIGSLVQRIAILGREGRRGRLGALDRGRAVGRAAGARRDLISARFHNALAHWIVAVAQTDWCPQVALSGGVFQNSYLVDADAVLARRARLPGRHAPARARQRRRNCTRPGGYRRPARSDEVEPCVLLYRERSSASSKRTHLSLRRGKVDFAGIQKEVCLAFTPEASVGRLRSGSRRLRSERGG